jgi:hypothetical protein
MTKPPTFSLLPTMIGAIIVLGIYLWRTVPLPAFDAPSFRNVTNITFAEFCVERIRIEDPARIQRFVRAIHLTHSNRCLCAHPLSAVFQRPSGQVRIHFCEHCFDVVEGKETRYYRMPKEFYAEFYTYAQGQHWNSVRPITTQGTE